MNPKPRSVWHELLALMVVNFLGTVLAFVVFVFTITVVTQRSLTQFAWVDTLESWPLLTVTFLMVSVVCFVWYALRAQRLRWNYFEGALMAFLAFLAGVSVLVLFEMSRGPTFLSFGTVFGVGLLLNIPSILIVGPVVTWVWVRTLQRLRSGR